MADWFDGVWVGVGALLAVLGAVAFEEWKTWRDAQRGLKRARELVAKLVDHNEDTARRMINELRQNSREDRIYFMFSAWQTVQVHFAEHAPTEEYVRAAGLFEEARYFEQSWRDWKTDRLDYAEQRKALTELASFRTSASQLLTKYTKGNKRASSKKGGA